MQQYSLLSAIDEVSVDFSFDEKEIRVGRVATYTLTITNNSSETLSITPYVQLYTERGVKTNKPPCVKLSCDPEDYWDEYILPDCIQEGVHCTGMWEHTESLLYPGQSGTWHGRWETTGNDCLPDYTYWHARVWARDSTGNYTGKEFRKAIKLIYVSGLNLSSDKTKYYADENIEFFVEKAPDITCDRGIQLIKKTWLGDEEVASLVEGSNTVPADILARPLPTYLILGGKTVVSAKCNRSHAFDIHSNSLKLNIIPSKSAEYLRTGLVISAVGFGIFLMYRWIKGLSEIPKELPKALLE